MRKVPTPSLPLGCIPSLTPGTFRLHVQLIPLLAQASVKGPSECRIKPLERWSNTFLLRLTRPAGFLAWLLTQNVFTTQLSCLSWDSNFLHANTSGCSQHLGEVRRHMVTAISIYPSETQGHQPLAVLPVTVCLGIHGSSYFTAVACDHGKLHLCQLCKATVSVICFPLHLYQKQHTFFLVFPLLYSNKVSSVWAYRVTFIPTFPSQYISQTSFAFNSTKIPSSVSMQKQKIVTTCFRMLLPFLVPLWSLIISFFFLLFMWVCCPRKWSPTTAV